MHVDYVCVQGVSIGMIDPLANLLWNWLQEVPLDFVELCGFKILSSISLSARFY